MRLSKTPHSSESKTSGLITVKPGFFEICDLCDYYSDGWCEKLKQKRGTHSVCDNYRHSKPKNESKMRRDIDPSGLGKAGDPFEKMANLIEQIMRNQILIVQELCVLKGLDFDEVLEEARRSKPR